MRRRRFYFLFVLLLALWWADRLDWYARQPVSSLAAPAYVQSTSKNNSTAVASDTLTLTLGSNANILVGARLGSTTSTLAITDNQNTGYTTDISLTDATNSDKYFQYRLTGAKSGSTTVTATISGGNATLRWWFAEISTSAGTTLRLDQTANANASTGSPWTTPASSGNTPATTVANELLIGSGKTENAQASFTAGTVSATYTMREQVSKCWLETATVSATGVQSATVTGPTPDSAALVVVTTFYELGLPLPLLVNQAVKRAAYY